MNNRDEFESETDDTSGNSNHVLEGAVADFRFLLPINSDGVVLYLENDRVPIVVALARSSRQVILVDNDITSLRYVQTQACKAGLQNVVPLQGNGCALPVGPASCDIAILNGVLGITMMTGRATNRSKFRRGN